jgi:hypothetical protein
MPGSLPFYGASNQSLPVLSPMSVRRKILRCTADNISDPKRYWQGGGYFAIAKG